MIDIKTDNPESKKCIETIVEKIVSCGGSLNGPMTLSCIDGFQSILVPRDHKQEGPLIVVPPIALPPINKFKIDLKGDDLYIDSYDEALNDVTVELMKLMMELYNISGKIKDYRQTSPWLFFNTVPELANLILKARNGHIVETYLSGKNFDTDEEIIKTFIKTRQLGFKTSSDANKASHVLMPIIDFLNHHTQSPSYYGLSEDGIQNLAVKASQPLADSNESFVSYGPFDAMDTMVNYGYPDNSARFTRSIRVEIDLNDAGRLIINGFTAPMQTRTPPISLSDLKFFMPNIISQTSGKLEISHIYIPGPGAPRALRRILSYLISAMAPNFSERQISDLVQTAEESIIQTNMNYYRKLTEQVTSLPKNKSQHAVALALKQAAQIQTEKIKIYDSIRQQLAA